MNVEMDCALVTSKMYNNGDYYSADPYCRISQFGLMWKQLRLLNNTAVSDARKLDHSTQLYCLSIRKILETLEKRNIRFLTIMAVGILESIAATTCRNNPYSLYVRTVQIADSTILQCAS